MSQIVIRRIIAFQAPDGSVHPTQEAAITHAIGQAIVLVDETAGAKVKATGHHVDPDVALGMVKPPAKARKAAAGPAKLVKERRVLSATERLKRPPAGAESVEGVGFLDEDSGSGLAAVDDTGLNDPRQAG
jgi:hypothetical protein